ncbi:hypothetical protein [Streptomyces sp. NPDC055681]
MASTTPELNCTPAGTVPLPSTSLGHLALHFRPGERALATRFFELLGARVRDFPNQPVLRRAAVRHRDGPRHPGPR